MEKTLEIRLSEQRDAIREAILEEPEPGDMSWESKIAWERARIRFVTIINGVSHADL